ncbi:probable protein phosphatase 2C 30 [Phragmites australis]|uniref:probable protein phosphatase 2C 30 n=1 Tax=Phragmites australis TaxID=29695 RepID=UPI002D7760DF|nr:probable protein phosphatase 2C 30 [Phragmites australis]
MAEIYCEVAAGSDRKGECGDTGGRAARRRRMEIRRLRVVAEEASTKRRRLAGDEVDGVRGPAPRYGVTSVCGRRRDMEDAVSARPGFLHGHHFFGVFDGHGCSHVATSCGERMHEIVAEEATAGAGASGSDEAARWRSVMEKSYARMDAEAVGSRESAGPAPTCRCEMQLPKCDHVGSTAVVAVVGPRCLVVANCGDSRAVLYSGGAAIPLSADHKPDRPDELERIQAAGGRVIFWDGARVFGMLAMSRAIGDSYLKPFVIANPEVRVVERRDGEDEFLILASDGLWDVVSNEVACNVVRACLRIRAPRGGERSSPTSSLSPRQSSGSSSSDEEVGPSDDAGSESNGEDKACAEATFLLTKLALARQTADNVSVVVVNLKRRPRS